LRPGGLLHLYRVRLRSRLVTELVSLAGIAIGVALVFAALIANTSLSGSVRELSEGIVGRADLQLSGRTAAGFEQRVLRRVQAIPDADAAPVAEARVNLAGPAGLRSVLLLGGDPGFGTLGGTLLRGLKPTGRLGRAGLLLPAPLADDLGLGRGDPVAVETGAGTARTRVAGRVGGAELGGLAESPVALAPLALVQRLAAMRGRISRIFVAAAPGRKAAVEAALERIGNGRLNLAPADREVELFERAAYPTRESTALFSVLSALVGFLFALNATLLTLPQRRRLIADLRLAGYEPATVVEILLVDAILLGAAGSAVGLLLGELAAGLLFGSLPGYLTSAFAIGSQRIVTWQSAVLAAGAGVLAVCLAVLIPIRAAFSRRQAAGPAAAAGPTDLRLLAGAVASTGLSVAIAIFASAFSLAAIAVLLLALLVFLQPWLGLTAAAFEAGCRRFRATAPILAALELRAASSRARTVALAATGAVAAFAALSIGGARADLQRGLDGVAVDLDRGAGVWVAFRGPTNIFGTTAISLPREKLANIEALRGVKEVSLNRGSFIDVAQDRVWALGPAGPRVGRVLRRQVREGAPALAVRRLRRGGWIALSEGLAADLGVGVGDRVSLPLPVPTRLRVAALTTNFGWPGGTMVITASTYSRAWGSAAAGTLGIDLEPGARPADIVNGVRSVLGRGSPLSVETASARVRRQRDTSRAGLSRLTGISILVLVSSVLAMAASMAGLVWQRRPSFAALKLHGLGEGVLWRALLIEGTLLLGAGCLAGVLFGLIGQVLLDRALASVTGFPVVYEVAGATALQVLALLTGAAVAVLSLPGWLAVRARPHGG
jgi:putative ABC transport system permease protein